MNQSTVTNEATLLPLSELENARAIDLIERAERTDPRCACGRHMVVVAHGGSIWLECASKHPDAVRDGGLFARLEGLLGHSSRRILDLPTAD